MTNVIIKFEIKRKRAYEILLFLLLLVIFTPIPAVYAQNTGAELLIRNYSGPESPVLELATLFQMKKGWHIYWKNPGDTGLPVQIEWVLPEGFRYESSQWPVPEKISTPPLMSYGYKNSALILHRIMAPNNLKSGTVVEIENRIKWLECNEICIPGEKTIKIKIPIGKFSSSSNKNRDFLFHEAEKKFPQQIAPFNTRLQEENNRLNLKIISEKKDFLPTYFFPETLDVFDYASEQFRTNDGLSIKINEKFSEIRKRPPTSIKGILIAKESGENRAYEIEFPVKFSSTAILHEIEIKGVLIALLFSFLGGIILNLMPCVLPVLSIKIMHLIKKSNEKKGTVILHGTLYSAGVILSFLTLAGILLILRAGGEEIGWGFQLQSPLFVAILAAFLFLFALNMVGVFEIGSSLISLDSKAKSAQGLAGAFSSGILATIVATPCTGPFMASALGFAATQPPIIALTIFSFLGLGMAFPYLLLSFFPGFLRYIPKPGAWMEILKQAMGFFLFATVVWLIWLLGRLAGVDVLGASLGGLLLISFGAWIYGRWNLPHKNRRARTLSSLLFYLLLFAAIYINYSSINDMIPLQEIRKNEDSKTENTKEWIAFSQEKLDKLLQQNKRVFIDFTADWCLTCKVNKQVALRNRDVQKKFMELNVVKIRADWTRRDAQIAKILKQFGRNGVPLYVLYSGNPDEPPVILPEILTPQIVLDALNSLH